jgi:dTDP-4-amino-4,6-dideoxygalactose transaminase
VTSVDEAQAGVTRDELIQILRAENILAKRYFYPGCRRLVPEADPGSSLPLPVTDRLLASVLVLPGGASMTSGDVQRVCEMIKLALSHSAEIRSAVASRARGSAVLLRL